MLDSFFAVRVLLESATFQHRLQVEFEQQDYEWGLTDFTNPQSW